MVALLSLDTGEAFAVGKSEYAFRPATEQEESPRLFVRVHIEGVQAAAVIDTAAPYVVCTPLIARQLGLSHDDALGEVRLLIRGFYRRGYLHLLNVHFPAVIGESLDVMATAFVPDEDEEEGWSDLPPFIGLGGCLARMRFAIDPGSDTFYFGPLR